MTLTTTRSESIPPATSQGRLRWRAFLVVMRPRQWAKNLFILAPLLFSGKMTDPASLWRACAAFAVFCVVSSGVYALNDVLDRDADRAHPLKQFRPIARGDISPTMGVVVGVVLLLTGFSGALVLQSAVGALVGLYIALNVVYTVLLKRIVILDVFTIAAFFVIRLLVGAAAVSVVPSIWLLLCGGLLALYLAFAKRRHELESLQESSVLHRAVLSQYSAAFLDQLSVVLLAITVVAYIMYTLESETARQVGSNALTYSTVFVLYGVIRYLWLVHQKDGGDPAESLLTDRSLGASVVLWAIYCGIILYRAS